MTPKNHQKNTTNKISGALPAPLKWMMAQMVVTLIILLAIIAFRVFERLLNIQNERISGCGNGKGTRVKWHTPKPKIYVWWMLSVWKDWKGWPMFSFFQKLCSFVVVLACATINLFYRPKNHTTYNYLYSTTSSHVSRNNIIPATPEPLPSSNTERNLKWIPSHTGRATQSQIQFSLIHEFCPFAIISIIIVSPPSSKPIRNFTTTTTAVAEATNQSSYSFGSSRYILMPPCMACKHRTRMSGCEKLETNIYYVRHVG